MSLLSQCAKKTHARKSNFTIDHILNVAGTKKKLDTFQFPKEVTSRDQKFEWLHCTRYRPPKLPRQRKKERIQPRRKLSRNPRIPFSSSQVALLEAKFMETPYLSSGDVSILASFLKLSEARVKIWFQNRRARDRREKEGKAQMERTPAADTFGIQSTPRPSPATALPFDFAKSHPFDYFDSLRRTPCSEHANCFQAVTPLDFHVQQIVYRPHRNGG